MLVSSVTALGLLAPAEAVVTHLANSSVDTISIRVGSVNAVDTVNFGTIAGDVVGNNLPVAAAGTVEIVVSAEGTGNRDITVNADSVAGMSCQSVSSCGGAIIPFSTVSWTVGSLSSPGGSQSLSSMPAGSFNGSNSQTVASFKSSHRLSNTLSFKYANDAVYPAGTYRGRVTFTASMP